MTQVADKDKLPQDQPDSPEQVLQSKIINGDFNSAVVLLKTLTDKADTSGINLPLHHKRLLLEAGYYSIVSALGPVDRNSAVTVLANLMSGRETISERDVRQLLAVAPNDFDQAIATSQVCSIGSVFGLIPRSYLRESADLLSLLASQLESCGELEKACEVYLRLGMTLVAHLTNGHTLARALYKHVKDIAPSQAILSEATYRETEATFLSVSTDDSVLIAGLEKLVGESGVLADWTRAQLTLRLAHALLKKHKHGLEYVEHAIGIAETAGDSATIFQGLLTIINQSIASGNSDKANQLLIVGEKLCQVMGFPAGILSCQVSRLHIMLAQVDRDKSRAILKNLLPSVRSLPGGLVYSLPVGCFCDQLGMYAESDSLRDWARRCFKRTGYWALESLALRTQAQGYASRRETSRACTAYKKLEKLHRKRGEDSLAIEVQSLYLQLELVDLAASLDKKTTSRRNSRILKQTRRALDSMPNGIQGPLRARLLQVEGNMLLLTKRYAEAQSKLNESIDLFRALEDRVNSAFVMGVLGLVQLESVRNGLGSRAQILESAEGNLTAAAKTLQSANIRSEAARMWKMAAVVSLELSQCSLRHLADGNHRTEEGLAEYNLKVKRNSEFYLEQCWNCLSEINSISQMDYGSNTDGVDQAQIVRAGLEIAIELSKLTKEGKSLLDKWQLREKQSKNLQMVQ